jgi:hypothetical protein
MATHTSASVILTSRTPLSVVWRVDNDGGADNPTLVVPRATVLAQLLEGPLKARLAKTLDWRIFNVTSGPLPYDDTIRFTLVEGGLAESRVPPTHTLVLTFQVDALEFSIDNFAGELFNPCNILVEMRLVHSSER